MYGGNEKCLSQCKHGFLSSSCSDICILPTSSYSSPTTDLLETVSRLLRERSRLYPHTDRNMAENLVVRLQVAVDSVRRLVESLDPDDRGNDVRIPELESLLR